MANATDKPTSADAPSQPAWDIARLFPDHGHWSEADYLALNTNRLVEFSDGHVEVLPRPTESHQLIVAFLYGQLLAFVTPRALGMVLFSALPIRLWPGKFREPDVVFMRTEHAARRTDAYWNGADLVMEVVSDDGRRRRDLEVKRDEYARAGIPEYWIVDPREGRITVLRLDGGRYAEHGAFLRGGRATSVLLPGFEVDVTAALAPRA
jgi:Uma2 family endonuclease